MLLWCLIFFFFFSPGIIHLLTNMLFQVPVGVLIEREIGYVNRTNKGLGFKETVLSRN